MTSTMKQVLDICEVLLEDEIPATAAMVSRITGLRESVVKEAMLNLVLAGKVRTENSTVVVIY